VIPNAIKIPMPFEYVFPSGAMCLGVEPVTDFDKKGTDKQARDENGVRLWSVKVMDLDEDAGKFGRSTEAKVKIAAEHQPVPPSPKVPGYPPLVAFTDMTVTPYTDVQKCTGPRKGEPHKCRSRQAWSMRASAMVDPSELSKSADKPAGKAA
jgi:hypothetical protein